MANGVIFADVYVGGKLATNLNDLNATANSNVNGILFANSKPSREPDDHVPDFR